MRSRFTAYVKRVPQYIVRPSHAQTLVHCLWGLMRECRCCMVTLILAFTPQACLTLSASLHLSCGDHALDY